MVRIVPNSCSALLAGAAIAVGCSSPNAGSGGAGSGGATIATTGVTSGHGPSSTHAAATTGSAGQQGAGGSSFVCSPPAASGSLYETTAISYALDNVSMCQYRGDVLLIIDTAAA
jgi:hypothetical protein